MCSSSVTKIQSRGQKIEQRLQRVLKLQQQINPEIYKKDAVNFLLNDAHSL
jgi:hypothetical protein